LPWAPGLQYEKLANVALDTGLIAGYSGVAWRHSTTPLRRIAQLPKRPLRSRGLDRLEVRRQDEIVIAELQYQRRLLARLEDLSGRVSPATLDRIRVHIEQLVRALEVDSQATGESEPMDLDPHHD